MSDPRRVVPRDPNAEKAVIGAVLVSETAIEDVSEVLRPEDFFSENLRHIYAASLKLHSQGERVDQITVMDELKRVDEFDKVGGRKFIFDLVDSVPMASNARRYAEIVRGKAMLRNLIDVSSRAQEEARKEPEDVRALLDETEANLHVVGDRMLSEREGRSLEELMEPYLRLIMERIELGELGGGIETGYPDLDRIIGGYGRSDMVVVGARPRLGKTSFAIASAVHASNAGYGTAVFSLEMGWEQIVDRVFSRRSGVPLSMLRRGNVPDAAWPELLKMTEKVANMPMYVDDASGLTPMRLRAKLRRANSMFRRRGKKLDVVFLDYVQLMKSDLDHDSRQRELEDITRSIKSIAKEMDIAFVAAAQLSRTADFRPGGHPMLSDLKSSGSFEEDSDIVLLIKREDLYRDDDDEPDNKAEVIVAKNRNGPTGNVNLVWREELASFESMTWRRED